MAARTPDISPMTDAEPAWTDQTAPSLDDFARLAESAFAGLPEGFRAFAGDVEFRILDFADSETLSEMGMQDPFELTGLYHGVDLSQRTGFDPSPTPRGSICIAVRFWTSGASAATWACRRSSPMC